VREVFRTFSSSGCLAPAKWRTTLVAVTTSTAAMATHAIATVATSHGLLRSTQQRHVKIKLYTSHNFFSSRLIAVAGPAKRQLMRYEND